jgi:hypothetical protein
MPRCRLPTSANRCRCRIRAWPLRPPPAWPERPTHIRREAARKLTRRLLIGAAPDQGSWQGPLPELAYAIVPAENASGVTERWGPFLEYRSRPCCAWRARAW